MKKINPYSFLVLLMFLWACTAHKVNIEKMSEKQRTAYLTNTAKEVFKKYPEFYKENVSVTIEKQTTHTVTENVANKTYNNPDSPWYGMRPGQTYYSVTFEQDGDVTDYTQWLKTSVSIREDTGKAMEIQIGSMIYSVKE